MDPVTFRIWKTTFNIIGISPIHHQYSCITPSLQIGWCHTTSGGRCYINEISGVFGAIPACGYTIIVQEVFCEDAKRRKIILDMSAPYFQILTTSIGVILGQKFVPDDCIIPYLIYQFFFVVLIHLDLNTYNTTEKNICILVRNWNQPSFANYFQS